MFGKFRYKIKKSLIEYFKRAQAAERIFSPPRSPEEFFVGDEPEVPFEHILDDLPQQIDDSENESDEEIIHNASGEDVGDDAVGDNISSDSDARRTRGNLFNARSSFMTGKFIRLQVASAFDEPCVCCLCRLETDRDEGFNVSVALEKKLFKNGLVGTLGDGLGISFERNGNVDLWQVICRDCGYINDQDQVDVISEVFTLRFHASFGNIELDSGNIVDPFSFAPMLGLDMVRDIRAEFNSLERMALIERRYMRPNTERKFHFTEEFQR